MHRSRTALALICLSVILFVFGFPSTFTASAAEIGCATRWFLPQDTPPQKIEQLFHQRFRSGRSPLGTCMTGVLRGAIQQGDDEKILNFYRANHPFMGTFLLISNGGNVEAAIN